MDTFLEILKYCIPALIVVLAVWVILRRLLAENENRRDFELRMQVVKHSLPTQLAAYERLTLLIERTKPQSMLNRLSLNGLSVPQLQQMLLQMVRDEFEHNAAQQIYVSQNAWSLIQQSRESLIQLINTVATKMNGANVILFSNALIEIYGSQSQTPSDVALANLNQEVKKICL